MLMLVTFFKPFAGLSGFIALIIALAFSFYTGINRTSTQKGLFTFNALMMGIGMGTFYNSGFAFWLLLILLVILTVVFSSVLWNQFSKFGLPFLIIPFILCFWLVILVTGEFSAIDLTSRNFYWINDMYTIGDKHLLGFIMFFENLPVHPLIITFFKSLSSIFFQDNVLAGLIIFTGILLHSRISATLIITGFVTAIIFNTVVHTFDTGMNAYLLGANFILVAMAIGSFFVIPSPHSYLWAIISVPFTFIISIGLSKILNIYHLPVYTLPFCFVTITLVFFFSIKRQIGRVVLTPIQYYSPEKNLYSYLSTRERRSFENHFPLQLPFLGEWIVSQGYDGDITHKGDWSKALDFVIVDSELKTYTKFALQLENFYCYNKPVLAAGDGYVTEIIDHIADNEVGIINQQQNWGNTIIIKHAENLFTKMCHLRKHSFRVKVGDYVKQGDIVAACGNSGRSPEPHLHFQIQSTAYVGGKAISYPFSFYRRSTHAMTVLEEHKVPEETEIVRNTSLNESLSKAFGFIPGYRLEVASEGFETTMWEVFTDALNFNYLYCYLTKSVAYFSLQKGMFYFISFDGDRNSLLYYFYLSCYKICLSTETQVPVYDKFPLQFSKTSPGKWLQDVIAPFYIFRKIHYKSMNIAQTDESIITIKSGQDLEYFNKLIPKSSAIIEIEEQKIKSFQFSDKTKKIKVSCTPKE